jgi:hypothetical protein
MSRGDNCRCYQSSWRLAQCLCFPTYLQPPLAFYAPGYYTVADTAFPRGARRIQSHIQVPLKAGAWLPTNRQEQEAHLAFNPELTSY